MAQQAAGIEVQRKAVVPFVGAAVGESAGNRHNVSDHGNYYDTYVQEVIYSNNDHPEFRAVNGRLEQPVNRQ